MNENSNGKKKKILHEKMKIGEQRTKISKVEMQISNQPMIWQQFNGYRHLIMVNFWIGKKGELIDFKYCMAIGVRWADLSI